MRTFVCFCFFIIKKYSWISLCKYSRTNIYIGVWKFYVMPRCLTSTSSLASSHILGPRCFVRCFVFCPLVSIGALFPALGGVPEEAEAQGKRGVERLRPVPEAAEGLGQESEFSVPRPYYGRLTIRASVTTVANESAVEMMASLLLLNCFPSWFSPNLGYPIVC